MRENLTSVVTEVEAVEANDRIRRAINLAQDGSFDGGHHKMWVIDQMVRILAGEDYESWRTEFANGEDGPETYSWDEGTPP